MRQFGKDAPEFFSFQIEGSDEVYKIPLAGSMTNREIMAFEDTDGDYRKQVEWLKTFLGDMVDDMTPAQTGDILRVWSQASREEQGATPGES